MAISSVLLAALGLLTLAQGQSNPLDGLPKCAQSCATNILSSSACGSTNGACICSNGPILSTLSCCLLANCNPDETQQAVQFAGNICRLFNQPNVPTAAVCSTSSTTSSSASSSSMTPPIFGQNSGMGGHIVPLASSTSTSAAPSESAMSGAMGGAATTTASDMSGSGMAASSSASAPASTGTGAASHLGPAMGLAGAVVGGLAVLL